MPPKPDEGLRPWHKAVGDKMSRTEVTQFARGLLESDAYRNRLRERAERGVLSPLVEVMLWNYAYGKPPEELNINVGEQDLSRLTTDQLAERARAAYEALREAKDAEDALDIVAVDSVIIPAAPSTTVQ